MHFPIGLILTAAAIECFRLRRREPSQAALVCTLLGSLAALAAIGCGWLYAEEVSVDSEDLLFRHRWLGVAGAVVAALAGLLGRRARAGGGLGAYRAVLFIGAALVGLTGHFGGTLVYGEGFLTDMFRAQQEPPAVAPVEESTEAPEPEPPAPEPEASEPVASEPVPVDFVSEVLPIFEAVCFDCHGPTGRAKGMLRLSDVTQLFSDDPSYPIAIPGDAEGSPLVQRISLPADHEDRMPPEGDPLTAEQVRTITTWVREGAPHPERP